MPRRTWLAGLLAMGTQILLGCTAKTEGSARGLDITGANYGLDFHLTDPRGRERSLADYRGKVVMLFFGFIQCPDICPNAMARAAEVMGLLGDDGTKVQTLFITVDPERDTAEALQAYTSTFHPSFVGLYTDLQRTKETADHFKVFYRKVPAGGSYTMDHTAMTYVYDPAGRLRLALRSELTAKDVAADLAVLLKVDPGAGKTG